MASRVSSWGSAIDRAVVLAVALSRTPTPVGEDVLQSPVEELLGGPLPDAPNLLRLLTGWSGNGVGLAIVGLGTALYLRGVWTLHRRGDAWPVGRTISWLTGMVVIAMLAIGIFSAFMLYDLKRIVDGGETNYISATLALYLSIFNVFQSLLALLGIFGGERD